MKTKLLFAISILLSLSACSKNYKSYNLESEFKKGKPVKELINANEKLQLVAIIETKFGNIELELFRDDAPKAVENFVGLSLQGYYNGIKFHRIVKNLLIQGGDSTGTGKAGRSYFGSEFENETSYKHRFDSPGVLAMANRGPDTNTSQFFITIAPIPFLDGKHTIFGKVIEGLEVVQKIVAQETNEKESPISNIFINKISIEKRIFN